MNQKALKSSLLILNLFLLGSISTLNAQDKFSLTSSAFEHGKAIPDKYTCADKDILPGLSWSNIPKGTKSFAIIMDDPDAPMGTWVHWVIYNIPDSVKGLREGENAADAKAHDGLNSWGSKGYRGPCPPYGMHNYLFRIFALDKVLAVADMTKDELLEAIKGHIISEAELRGTFER